MRSFAEVACSMQNAAALRRLWSVSYSSSFAGMLPGGMAIGLPYSSPVPPSSAAAFFFSRALQG